MSIYRRSNRKAILFWRCHSKHNRKYVCNSFYFLQQHLSTNQLLQFNFKANRINIVATVFPFTDIYIYPFEISLRSKPEHLALFFYIPLDKKKNKKKINKEKCFLRSFCRVSHIHKMESGKNRRFKWIEEKRQKVVKNENQNHKKYMKQCCSTSLRTSHIHTHKMNRSNKMQTCRYD